MWYSGLCIKRTQWWHCVQKATHTFNLCIKTTCVRAHPILSITCMRVKKKCLKLVVAAFVAGAFIVLSEHGELMVSSVNYARPHRGQDELYLGLDLSTQSLKYTVLDSQLQTVHAGSVNFDEVSDNSAPQPLA